MQQGVCVDNYRMRKEWEIEKDILWGVLCTRETNVLRNVEGNCARRMSRLLFRCAGKVQQAFFASTVFEHIVVHRIVSCTVVCLDGRLLFFGLSLGTFPTIDSTCHMRVWAFSCRETRHSNSTVIDASDPVHRSVTTVWALSQ